MKDFASGTVPGPDVSPNGSPGGVRRASGELLGAPGRPKVVKMKLTWDQFEFQEAKSGLKVG